LGIWGEDKTFDSKLSEEDGNGKEGKKLKKKKKKLKKS